MNKTIWLLRHAENHRDESLGLSLTQDGIQKAHEIGRRLAIADQNAPTLIVSTSSNRGRTTASILKEEFDRHSKPTYAVTSELLGSLRDQDLADLLVLIANMEEACAKSGLPAPESLLLIMHKQNALLPIFSAMLDPSAYMADGTLDAKNDKRFSLEELNRMVPQMNDDELAAYLGGQNTELQDPHFLDALQFEFRENNWSSMGLDCAQFRQKLEIA